jgi:uncharacterized protein YjbI with pentapeptide repeats
MRFFVLVVICTLVTVTDVRATSCYPPPEAPMQRVRDIPIIFAGEVTTTPPSEHPSSLSGRRVRVRVNQVWKGLLTLGSEVSIWDGRAFAPGERALFIAMSAHTGELSDGGPCGGQHRRGLESALEAMDAEVGPLRRRAAASAMSPDLQLSLGNALLRWRDLPAARAAFEAAGQGNVAARVGIARVALAEGRTAEALALARALSEGHPDDVEATRLLGQVRLASGDLSALPGLSLRGAELVRLDLSGADLRGQDLTDATLRGVRLVGADLRGSRFVRTELSFVDLSRADLRGAVFSDQVSLHGILNNADLRGAQITDTYVGRDSPPGMNAQGVRLDDARLERVTLQALDLSDASLPRIAATQVLVRHSSLRGANLSGARLSLFRFETSQLSGASFRNARLDGVSFGGTRVTVVDFRGARLHEVRFPWAYLNRAVFAGASLVAVDFRDATLGAADFRGTSLRGAVLDRVALQCETRFPAGFDPERAGMDITTATC